MIDMNSGDGLTVFDSSFEQEVVPSWFSVICGQGTYDVRAFSHSDAQSRALQSIKETNEARISRSMSSEPTGFAFSQEYDREEVLRLEIMWRLTGGDIDKVDSAKPILRQYTEINPYVRENPQANTKDNTVPLFQYRYQVHKQINDENHAMRDEYGRAMERHELILTDTWQADAAIMGLTSVIIDHNTVE